MRPGPLPFVLLWLFSIGVPANAGSVQSWSLSTVAEFANGSLDGTALDAEGTIRLAPEAENLWGPAEGIVWDVAETSRDGVLVALSGPGRLLHLDSDGAPAAWFEAGEDESLVTAVVGDEKGGAYFGLSPAGTLMYSDGAGVTQAAATESIFIWALARESSGAIWIGTGTPGRLLRYHRGTLTTVAETGDDPIRCIQPLPQGGVLVGTGGKGRVIRIESDGRPFVLFDSDEPEVVDLELRDDGTVFALTAAAVKQPGGSSSAGQAAKSPDATVRVTASPPADGNGGDNQRQETAAPAAPKKFEQPPGGALYSIDPQGNVRRLWRSLRELPFGLAQDGQGRLLVATGDRGRILTIDDTGEEGFLMRVGSKQASALSVDAAGRILVGGTTDATVSRLTSGRRGHGAYLSPTLDATNTADWGRLSWEADVPRGTELKVSVRGGNTAEPDETWTEWVVLDATERNAETRLLSTRWFQARLDLQGSRKGLSPRVRRLELLYMPRNRPPGIGNLRIEPPGAVWVRAPSSQANQQGPKVADDPVALRTARSLRSAARPNQVRKSYEQGARTVHWVADDPDADELRYRLDIRKESGTTWLPLALNLEVPFHSWDARVMPDGLYRIRLTVDDAPANAAGRRLSTRRVSEAFRIDNSRPEVDPPRIAFDNDGYDVRFTARDTGGIVAAAQVSVDGEDWEVLEPIDGVPDSVEEQFEIHVDKSDGVRALRVRVLDEAGNLGGASWALGNPAGGS